MGDLPPEQACEEQIRNIVSDLFRTMLQMEVALTHNQDVNHSGVVTATIEFGGAWEGVLELGCSHTQAVCFAERFLQMPMEEFNQEVHDAVGELANIIAGNLKRNLPNRVELGTPTVILRNEGVVALTKGRVVGSYSFASDIGSFWIRMLQKHREEAKE